MAHSYLIHRKMRSITKCLPRKVQMLRSFAALSVLILVAFYWKYEQEVAPIRAFTRQGHLQKDEVAILQHLLELFDQVCHRENISYCLHGGALLGLARFGRFMPWDDDVDMAVWREDLIRLADIFEDSQEYGIYTSHQGISKLFSRKNFTKKYRLFNFPYIDIFTMSLEEDTRQVYIDDVRQIRISLSDLFPTFRYKLLGREVSMPRNVHTVLRRFYRGDYMRICRTSYFDHRMNSNRFGTRLYEMECEKLRHLIRDDD